MKRFLRIIAWTSASILIGFVLGRVTANQRHYEVLKSQQQPSQPQQQIYAVGVDCYDKDGNLVHTMGEKYGGATIACGTGQFARVKQPNPPKHIEVP